MIQILEYGQQTLGSLFFNLPFLSYPSVNDFLPAETFPKISGTLKHPSSHIRGFVWKFGDFWIETE